MSNPGHGNDRPDPQPHADQPEPTEPAPAEPTTDTQFGALLERGPIAPLSVWRRAYRTLGVPWPGDAEVRHHHRVTDTDTGTPPPTTVWQMSWPTSDQHETPPDTAHTHHTGTDDSHRAPGTQRPTEVLLTIVTEIRDDLKQVKRQGPGPPRPARQRHGRRCPMTVTITLELDDWECREAHRLAAASGMTIDQYVSQALRDARLHAWHHRHRGQPTAAQRLADALGWHDTPTLTPAEQQHTDVEFHTAQAHARRLYSLETEQFEQGWDAALNLAAEIIHDTHTRIQQLSGPTRPRHQHDR